MRILLISHEDYEYDGRLRALINVFSQIGDLTCFIGSGPKESWIAECDDGYPIFIKKSIRFAKKMGQIDVLVLDNRKATIPGLIIKKICKPKKVIQDCREFYRIKEVEHLSSKIGCIFEQKMIRRADILIAANDERAHLMKEEYGLSDVPLTYENLRELKYESQQDFETAKQKIDKILGDENCLRIISSSGCDVERTNDTLVKNLTRVNKKVRLFLVGSSTNEDETKIRKLASQDKTNEIIITGKLNQAELKYLISKCDIGVVNYGQYDTNNKYCASGKLFEFIYEGVPVITTSNPPLTRLCNQFGIGESDDQYFNGINKMIAEYKKYKSNTENFATNHTVEENDQRLVRELKERLDIS